MEADFQQEEQQRKQRTLKVNQLQSKLDANNKLFWLLNDSFNDDDLANEVTSGDKEKYENKIKSLAIETITKNGIDIDFLVNIIEEYNKPPFEINY